MTTPDIKSGTDYDLVVIGGGPGGYVAAIRAQQLGMKTLLVEEKDLGGTCLNYGCIPTKALLHAAEIYDIAKHSASYGILIPEAQIDYPAVARKKDQIVRQLRGGVEKQVKSHGGTILKGRARFLDAHTIEVSGPDPKIIRADKFIIATGSRPARPQIPGIDGQRVLDSDALLDLKTCPESLIIIGGGVIGVEFATLFSQMGKKVTILEMMPEILPGTDAELTAILRQKLESDGVKILTGARVTGFESNESASCTYELAGQQHQIEAELIVVAIGRRPNSENLGLQEAGVAVERWFIQVNSRMETTARNIYAIGDVTGKVQLAHVASEQALVAVENAAGHHKEMSYDIIPSCIYTHPEMASVGLTEEAARQRGFQVKTGSFPVAANGKSIIMGLQTGLAKIITDQSTGEILGAHILAPRATDMIAEICVAMKLESTVNEVAETIHPHPTVSEIWLETAQDALQLSIHKPRKNVQSK